MAISPRMRRDPVGLMTDFKPVPRPLWHILTEILPGGFPGLLGQTPVIFGQLFASNHGGYFASVIVGIAIVR